MKYIIEGDGTRGINGKLIITSEEGLECLRDFLNNLEE